MFEVKSARAQRFLAAPVSVKTEAAPEMRTYDSQGWSLKALVEGEGGVVKKMSFAGEDLAPWQKVVLEALAAIVTGRDVSRLDNVSLRECEAFLRDRNSEPALEGLDKSAEDSFTSLIQWLRRSPSQSRGQEYTYDKSKGPFRALKVTDRIKEIKSFLNSHEIILLYRGLSGPELVDIDDLTVYVSAPYKTENERAIFEELHALGVQTFSEENLNFIPES